jgi:hypothetical protein
MDEPDDNTIGWNMNEQKLHCMVVLNDVVGKKLSNKAGEAFFRAFVVESRETGEVWCKQRFRYTHGDSWFVMKAGSDTKLLSRDQQVRYFANAVATTMRIGVSAAAGGRAVPEGVVECFYPPDPESSKATLEWLQAQDLLLEPQHFGPDGKKIVTTPS